MPQSGKVGDLIVKLIENKDLSDPEIIQSITQLNNLRFEDVKIIDEHDASLLHHAAKAGRRLLCQWAVEIYPNLINCKSNAESNVLYFAAQSGDLLTFQTLYQIKSDLLFESNFFKFNILHHVAIGGSLSIFEFVKSLISTEQLQEWLANRGTNNISPFDMVIDHCTQYPEKILLAFSEALRGHLQWKTTLNYALIKTIEAGLIECFQQLIHYLGIEWLNDPISTKLLTPNELHSSSIYLLDIATSAKQLSTVAWILEQDKTVVFTQDRTERHKWMLVDCLFRLNCRLLVDDMLEQNVLHFNIDESKSGLKTIHYAYNLDNPIMLEWFKEHDLDILPVRGLTKIVVHPLHLAAMNNATKIFQYYKDHRWEYNICDSHENLPIHYAIIYRANELTSWLVKNTAYYLEEKFKQELTPLHLAVCLGNTHATSELITALRPQYNAFMLNKTYSSLNFLIGVGLQKLLKTTFAIVARKFAKELLIDFESENLKMIDLPSAILEVGGQITYAMLETIFDELTRKSTPTFKNLSKNNLCDVNTIATLTCVLNYLDNRYSLTSLFKTEPVVTRLFHHAAAYNQIELLTFLTTFIAQSDQTSRASSKNIGSHIKDTKELDGEISSKSLILDENNHDLIVPLFNQPDHHDKCPIHYAAEFGAEDTFKFFIQNGINLHQLTKSEDNTSLTLAVFNGRAGIVKMIYELDKTALYYPVKYKENWRTAFAEAITADNDQIMDLFLEYGYDLNQPIAYDAAGHYHAVHYAAANRSLDKFKKLLAHEASFRHWNKIDKGCQTPFIMALQYNRANILEYLMANAADITLKVQRFHPYCQNILTQLTAIGWHPFHYLGYLPIPDDQEQIDLTILEKFLMMDFDLNLPTPEGQYLVQFIFNQIDLDTIKNKINNFVRFLSLLFKYGMQPNIFYNDGKLPYSKLIEKLICDTDNRLALSALNYCFSEFGMKMLTTDLIMLDVPFMLREFPYHKELSIRFARNNIKTSLVNLLTAKTINQATLNELLMQGALIDQTISANDFEKILIAATDIHAPLYLAIGLNIQSNENTNYCHQNYILSANQFKNHPSLNTLLASTDVNKMIDLLIFYLGYYEQKLAPTTQEQLFDIFSIICKFNNNGTLLRKIEYMIDYQIQEKNSLLLASLKKLYLQLYVDIHQLSPTLLELTIKILYSHQFNISVSDQDYFQRFFCSPSLTSPVFNRYRHRLLENLMVKYEPDIGSISEKDINVDPENLNEELPTIYINM